MDGEELEIRMGSGFQTDPFRNWHLEKKLHPKSRGPHPQQPSEFSKCKITVFEVFTLALFHIFVDIFFVFVTFYIRTSAKVPAATTQLFNIAR